MSKEKILPFLAKGTEEWVQGVPQRKFLDMVIAYRYADENAGLFVQPSEESLNLIKEHELSEEELYNVAMKNLEDLTCTVMNFGPVLGMWMGNINAYGSTILLRNDILKDIAQDCETENLYFTVMCSHEVMTLFYPIEYSLDEAVENHNNTAADIKHMQPFPLLYGSVYCFNAKTEEVTLVAKGVL